MRLLAVETSTDLCSAALVVNGQMRCESAEAPNRHGEVLGPLIAGLLGAARLAPADLDAIAFGQGPGSFTGIRIGCGLVQGLAWAAERPVVPVPSLLALAAEVGAAQCVTAFDARMGEAYIAAYRRQKDAWQEVVSPTLLAPGRAAPVVAGDDWLLCGSGFDAFTWLREAYAPQASGHKAGLRPHARGVAQVAVEWLGQGRGGVPADEAAPLYLRDKVALTVAERREAAA